MVTGLDSLDAKLSKLPQLMKEKVKAANEQNALEFMSTVASLIPLGEREPHLVSTLEMGPAKTPLGVSVSIGGPAAPYPAHLEFGHMSPGGVHVHAEPFWFTTFRVLRKKFRGRQTRAASAAIKALTIGAAGVS